MGTERPVLAADIGGTKTHIALFRRGRTRPVPLRIETYASRDAKGLESLLSHFLKNHPQRVDAAVFGMAGPVHNGRCRVTNLPWEADETRLARRFGFRRVRVVNDLVAAAQSIPHLHSRELLSLNRARAARNETVAVVAPGTGLGQALLVFADGRPRAMPSEGGHADLVPAMPEHLDLWRVLHLEFGHVSAERAVSGAGTLNLYRWLRDSGRFREPAWLARAIREGDPAREITLGALERRDPLCTATLRHFAALLGALCGNFALHCMARGGVYLGGGVPPRILPFLREGSFLRAFYDKGRFRTVMQKIPVRVILNERAALLGAAVHAFDAT